MNKDKKLSEYVKHMSEKKIPLYVVGRRIVHVNHFIDNSEEISKKGYSKYKKKYAERIALEAYMKDDICDFMNFVGIGFSRKEKVNDEKPLEKLSSINVKNKDLVNNFAYYLNNEKDYSSNTIYIYINSVRVFFEYSNDFNLENVKRYILTLEEKGFSVRTINLRVTALEIFSQFIKNPITIKRPKIQRNMSVDNIPTEKEYKIICDYLRVKNYRFYLYIRILATTGVRVSEFLKLKWEDIGNGEVELMSKGKKYRKIFFSNSIRNEVQFYLQKTGDEGFIACGKYGILSQRNLSMQMKTIGRNCGVDGSKMHPHAFRHFFAKMYLKKNNDVVELSNILGHESVDTTRIYLQKSNDEQKRYFNRSVTW